MNDYHLVECFRNTKIIIHWRYSSKWVVYFGKCSWSDESVAGKASDVSLEGLVEDTWAFFLCSHSIIFPQIVPSALLIFTRNFACFVFYWFSGNACGGQRFDIFSLHLFVARGNFRFRLVHQKSQKRRIPALEGKMFRHREGNSSMINLEMWLKGVVIILLGVIGSTWCPAMFGTKVELGNFW